MAPDVMALMGLQDVRTGDYNVAIVQCRPY
jgi:hypothetical protein